MFGVLNMLVSVASFLPIIIVGPVSDLIGTTAVLIIVALLVAFTGVLSFVRRGPLTEPEAHTSAAVSARPGPIDPVAVATGHEVEAEAEARRAGHAGDGRALEPDRRRRRAPGARRRRLTRAAARPHAPADLLVVGRIATLDGPSGPGWAGAIAVAGGRVVAAGREADVAALAGQGTRMVRLAPDEVALPGLTDAHLHLVEASLARSRVQLEGATSIDVLVERVREAAGRPVAAGDETGDETGGDAWIEGGGWDPDALGRWPTADDLERAAPGRRVALWAHDHHALLASAAALAQAGVVDERPDPAGGVIRRDASGRATGVLHETAARLVSALVPPPATATIADALRAQVRELLGARRRRGPRPGRPRAPGRAHGTARGLRGARGGRRARHPRSTRRSGRSSSRRRDRRRAAERCSPSAPIRWTGSAWAG